MTKYNVHLYREMRLTFVDIEADTPTDAAAIARDRPTDDADNIEDCDGENYAALVDRAGADDFGDSVTIDFEPERLRKAAVALSAALKAILPYAENEHTSLLECGKRDGDPSIDAEAEACGRAIDRAVIAIAAMEVTGVTPEADIQALSIADIWDIRPIQAVQENRPDLSDEQAWDVLQSARRNHDATIDINWDVLEYHADMLFGPAPETDAESAPVLGDQGVRFEIEHDPLETPHRAYVLVDGLYDVAILRTSEGIEIDVYLKDELEPIDTMTVRDDQVAAAHDDAD